MPDKTGRRKLKSYDKNNSNTTTDQLQLKYMLIYVGQRLNMSLILAKKKRKEIPRKYSYSRSSPNKLKNIDSALTAIKQTWTQLGG